VATLSVAVVTAQPLPSLERDLPEFKGTLAFPFKLEVKIELLGSPTAEIIEKWYSRMGSDSAADAREAQIELARVMYPESRTTNLLLKVRSGTVYHTVTEKKVLSWSTQARSFVLHDSLVRHVQNENEHWQADESQADYLQRDPTISLWQIQHSLAETNNLRLFISGGSVSTIFERATEHQEVLVDQNTRWYEAIVNRPDSGSPARLVYSERDSRLADVLFISTEERNQIGENAYTYFNLSDWRPVQTDLPNQARPFRSEVKAGFAPLDTSEPEGLLEILLKDNPETLHYRLTIGSYDPAPEFQDSDFTYSPPRDAPWYFQPESGEPVFHLSEAEMRVETQREEAQQAEQRAVVRRAERSHSIGGSLVLVIGAAILAAVGILFLLKRRK
jgi:hypothetical protein